MGDSVIKTPDGRLYTYLDLAVAPNEVLEKLMRNGTSPDVRQMVGWEYKGFNTLDLTALLGFRKFKKGFRAKEMPKNPRDPIEGYNVKVIQNGIADPWEPIRQGGKPIIHGFYDVYPVDPAHKDNLYPNALLLNYACGRNPIYDPSPVLRDYLVQIYPDNPDLLLGKAYIALGPFRVFVSYFILEKYNKSEIE